MSNNYLFGRGYQEFGNGPAVNERAKFVGQNVARERNRRGMSQAELAKAIGVRSQNTIASIETGHTVKSKHLPDIARVLKVKMADLDPSQGEQETSTIPGVELTGATDLLVYGTGEGGSGALVMTNEPVDRVKRPAPLATVRGGYGVIVVGESMTPLLRPGDIALIHPHLPPKPDDLCLFRAERHGEFWGTFKEYRGQTDTHWKVRRYGPKQQDFTLSKAEWPQCHVLVGKYSRR